MTEAQIAAEWLGFVHGEGTGWAGEGRPRARVLARVVGAGDQDVHRHDQPARASRASRRCSRSGSAPTATGATTRRTSSSASSHRAYRELEERLLAVYDDAVAFCRPGREPRRARPAGARGDRGDRASPASRPTRSATASGRAPTSRRTPTRPAAASAAAGMVLAIEPGCYWEGGGGLRVEDNFLVTDGGPEKLSPVPRRHRPGPCVTP